MNVRRLISALFLALVVSGIFTFWLSKKFGKSHAAVPEKLQYVASAANIEAGDTLKPAGLKLVDWPASAPLQGAFVKPEDLNGRIVLYPMALGEPIQERQLAPAGSTAGITVKIPEGMRAISLKSDEVVGVAGFLLPGSFVDVLVTFHAPVTGEAITSTVLQDVKILAAGQKMAPDPEGKATTVNVLTLLVDPRDAERAVLASTQGTVHFVLRNGTDREHTVASPAQMASLGGAPAPIHTQSSQPVKAAPALASPARYTVRTIAGGKQTVDTF